MPKSGDWSSPPGKYDQNKSLLVSMLEGNKSLTRQEIEAGFIQAGINQPGNEADKYRVKHTIALPEVEGILCSGVDKGKKQRMPCSTSASPLPQNFIKKKPSPAWPEDISEAIRPPT